MGKKEPQLQKKEKKKLDSQNSEQDAEQLFDKPVKQKNKDGQQFWSLTKNKRISISTYKGRAMVNIREYFQKDGQWLPTKKGISLAKDSWQTLKSIIKDIDTALYKAQK